MLRVVALSVLDCWWNNIYTHLLSVEIDLGVCACVCVCVLTVVTLQESPGGFLLSPLVERRPASPRFALELTAGLGRGPAVDGDCPLPGRVNHAPLGCTRLSAVVLLPFPLRGSNMSACRWVMKRSVWWCIVSSH